MMVNQGKVVRVGRDEVSPAVWNWLIKRVHKEHPEVPGKPSLCHFIDLYSASRIMAELRTYVAFETLGPSLINRFWDGFKAEQRAAKGVLPTFCLMGRETYEQFAGLCYFMAHQADDWMKKEENLKGDIRYCGVQVLCSFANEQGMIFGTVSP